MPLSIEFDDFDGTFPLASHFHEVNGYRMAYVEKGDGEPVLMLHGNPTWGYLYRNFIDPIVDTGYTALVPDCIGFGRSDKPLEMPYNLAQHISNLEKLLLGLDASNITLVMQDWGGPIGLGFAVRHPERIKRLVILNTWAHRIPEGTPLNPLLEEFRKPSIGEALVQGANLFVEGFLPAGIHKKDRITETLMRAYRAPFPDYKSRIGILAFPRDIPVGASHPSAKTMGEIQDSLSDFRLPTLIIWANRDHAFPAPMVKIWTSLYPHAEVHTLDDASHYLQEDAHEEIVPRIVDFLRKNP